MPENTAAAEIRGDEGRLARLRAGAHISALSAKGQVAKDAIAKAVEFLARVMRDFTPAQLVEYGLDFLIEKLKKLLELHGPFAQSQSVAS